MLLGREAECVKLDRLLADVRSGESRVLVLRGEAGVGKSALLDRLVSRASDCRVVTAAGVQSEMELPFAAVHQLCLPMLDLLDTLPEPQHDALGTAFGMRSGPAPDQFLISLAVLNLLAQAADERPLVCVIDDAQWLDRASAQVLMFVARRLMAERVACVFAVRESGETHALPGLPVLEIGGLRDADARTLVRRVVPGPLDEEVRDRIVFESRGNPLALLELPRSASAGGFLAAPTGQSLSGRLEDGFQRRLSGLSADTRMMLLLAAAEPLGDPALLWRAADVLGADTSAVDAADELVDFGDRVRFRHPLVRSAVYNAAAPRERREVHRALAEATDAATDPDRRAWHRAQSAAHPDEDIAAELEHSAGRAMGRGGLVAAAAFLERAVGLTPDPRARADRALDAARAKLLAGAPEPALALLAAAEAGPPDELRRLKAESLRAEISLTSNRGASAPAILLKAAEQLEPLDTELSRDTYLQALSVAMSVLPTWEGIIEVAAATRAAPPVTGAPRVTDLILDGLSLLYTKDALTAAPALRRAVTVVLGEETDPAEQLRWLWFINFFAMAVWDDETCRDLADSSLRLVRDSGAFALLPLVLSLSTMMYIFEGDLAEAETLNEEAKAHAVAADVWTTSGTMVQTGGDVGLAAFRGEVTATEQLAEAIAKESAVRGEGRTLEICQWVRSVLYNGLGQYDKALEAVLLSTVDHTAPSGVGVHWAPLELIEAAVRTGRLELAEQALERFSWSTQAGGVDWGLGLEARCRALISEGDEADRLYREAIERLGRTRMRPDLARAHLLYGEWLRRERRRVEAREQLRTAFDLFTEIGMKAFAERTERELLATGETARKRNVETTEELTPQEAQIARLARTGLTNKEIAERLYVSPRTVEYHLRKVFAKFGVTSRHQLVDLP
ncbi:regulatory LuxR family protein [Actinocorallia herbida]|uniref:Regulatory LuxR family protein n=2 Tax=Actinocorallia herbida TaxID=58109 RepID=A0A3N1CZH6_9ACTN|nr:regulatory LuxR family protein [Actinocorallia herbida]